MDMHRWTAVACLGLIDRGYFQKGKHRTAAACLGRAAEDQQATVHDHAAEDQQATVHDHAAEDQDTAAQTLPPDAPAATFPRLPSEGLRAAI